MKPERFYYRMQGNKQRVKLQYTSQIKFTKPCSLEVYEHSDITETVIAELDKLSAAEDRLEMINKHFTKSE